MKFDRHRTLIRVYSNNHMTMTARLNAQYDVAVGPRQHIHPLVTTMRNRQSSMTCTAGLFRDASCIAAVAAKGTSFSLIPYMNIHCSYSPSIRNKPHDQDTTTSKREQFTSSCNTSLPHLLIQVQ